MAYSHTGVQLAGYEFELAHITFKLDAAMTAAMVGEPVSIKTGVNGTVKRGADGDRIFGKLASYEDRTVEGSKVGAVTQRFGSRFKIKASDALAVGDTAVCAGNGEVKKATANVPADNVVVEVLDGFAVIHKI